MGEGDNRGNRRVALVLMAMACASAAAAPTRGGKPGAGAKPAEGSTAPADLNDLKMRVAAMEALFDLDLSAAQLKGVRAAAEGAAERRERTPAKAGDKLKAALKDLHDALAKHDSGTVPELREKADQAEDDDDDADLDDDVRPTDAARGKAAQVVRRLKASQIAAYLAEHADEVADPVEQMTDALSDIREADADDPDGEIRDTADEVGSLVAGLDPAKSKRVAEQVTAWLREGRAIKEADFEGRRAAFEETARKIVGDVPPMQVLSNWVEYEVARLLSNPQTAAAIDAMLPAVVAEEKEKEK